MSSTFDETVIGLVDAMLTLGRVLQGTVDREAKRIKRSGGEYEWFSQPVQDALHDLQSNKAMTRLLWPRDEKAMDIITRAAKSLAPRPIERFEDGAREGVEK